MTEESHLQIGRITGVFGVQGWVKVYSDTQPKENIFEYSPWWVETRTGWRQYSLLDAKPQGKGLVVRLEGCNDRDQAESLVGSRIAITRDQLPETENGEYYWSDLIGLQVINARGEVFGRVIELLETGGYDVMVVQDQQEQHFIPFVPEVYILDVDPESGRIEIDWERDYSE